MRRLLPLAAIITALLALPALLVPASAEQLGAVLGLGETVAGAPTAVRPFPVLGGMGITWTAPAGDPPTAYQVERKRPSGNWAAESARLDAATTRWVDRNLQPDTTAEYRVVAFYADQEFASDPVTAHRVAQDPAIGDTDILMIDADRGGAPTWLNDEIAADVTDSPAQQPGSRMLAAGTIELTMPAVLAGPGTYSVGSQDAEFRITQSGTSCHLVGTLIVAELAYTADLQVATMAARFSGGSCNGAISVFGEIRIKSTNPYAAIRISDPIVDFGRVLSGSQPQTREVTIENIGMTRLNVGSPVLDANDPDWDVRDSCVSLLDVGASCTLSIIYRPSYPANDQVGVRLYDDTGRIGHRLTLRGTAVARPSAPIAVTARSTLTGVDLSWQKAFDGNSPITGYVVRRLSSGSETTFHLPPDRLHWIEQHDGPAVYTVAAVNDVGEGSKSTPANRSPQLEQITVFSGPKDQPGTLGGTALPFGYQVIPMGAEPPSGLEADLAASPDGSATAYAVMDGSSRSLSVRREDGAGSYVTTRLLTAPAIRDLAWSPDGTRLAFATTDGSNSCVDLIEVTSHAVTRVGCGIDFPAWHPDTRSLIVQDKRVAGSPLARVEARAAGARLAVLAGSAGATRTAVSPYGDWLAFVLAGDRIGLLPIAGGTARIIPGAPAAAIGWSNGLFRLTRPSSGDQIYRLPDPVSGYEYPWWELVYDGKGEQISDFAWQGRGVTIAPTPAVSGRSVSISFDASAAVQSMGAYCALDNAQPKPCTSPFTATGLSSGQHWLRVSASTGSYPNGYGVVASRLFTIDGTGPVARVTAPAYEAATAATATVRYAATDSSGVKSYDVRYRKATYNGAFGAYSQPWTGTTATSVSLGLAAGYEYCVSVRAKDTFGNVGAWSAEKCFARPMDDRALTMASAGWTRGSWSAFYLNTATYTGKYGISLTRTVQGKRFYLVATRCNTCGLVSVYLGGKYIGAVNLWASTTQRQVVIGLPAQSSLFTGTLKITTRSTGKLVQIDGLGVRRT